MSSRRKSSRKSAKTRAAFNHLKRLPHIRGHGDQTKRLNAILVDLRNKTARQLEYWKAFQGYLVDQREMRKERIIEALQSRTLSGYENDALVRIVDTRYHLRPLSSYGSIVVPPGGRFNFGEISSYHQTFQALYLALTFQTAAAERFLRDQSRFDSVDQESLDLRLDPRASFSSIRVKVSNLTVLDIRNGENLRPFFEVIAEIKATSWLEGLARKLKQPTPRTVQNLEALQVLLLDPNFTQWGTLIDQPSASQWFGYYVRAAGIQGIVYPSVRNSKGFNLAIFPDTFSETNARVELVDEVAGVRYEDRVLDSSTALFQMQPSRSSFAGNVH